MEESHDSFSKGAPDHVTTPADVDRSYLWLAMPLDAREGWSKVHVNPVIACVAFMQSTFVGHGTYVVGCFAGHTWFTWHAHITGFILAAAIPIHMAGMWLHGPRHSASALYVAMTVIQAVALVSTSAMALTGPIRFAMFRSRLKTLGVTSVATLFLCFACLLAPAPAAMPQSPYTSLTAPLMTSADVTSRLMNSQTDASIVRIILDQAKEGCFWFGRHIPCGRYKWLAYASGAFSGAHFCTSIYRLFNQPQQSDSSQKARRMVAAVAIASLAELANVAVVLLKLASDTRHPAIAGDSAAARRLRSEAAFTLVSCVLSVAAVAVDVVGVQWLLAALNRVAVSVRRMPGRSSLRTAKGDAPDGLQGESERSTSRATCTL